MLLFFCQYKMCFLNKSKVLKLVLELSRFLEHVFLVWSLNLKRKTNKSINKLLFIEVLSMIQEYIYNSNLNSLKHSITLRRFQLFLYYGYIYYLKSFFLLCILISGHCKPTPFLTTKIIFFSYCHCGTLSLIFLRILLTFTLLNLT